MKDRLTETHDQSDDAPNIGVTEPEEVEQSEPIIKPGTIAYKFAQAVVPELVNQEDITDVPTNRS